MLDWDNHLIKCNFVPSCCLLYWITFYICITIYSIYSPTDLTYIWNYIYIHFTCIFINHLLLFNLKLLYNKIVFLTGLYNSDLYCCINILLLIFLKIYIHIAYFRKSFCCEICFVYTMNIFLKLWHTRLLFLCAE